MRITGLIFPRLKESKDIPRNKSHLILHVCHYSDVTMSTMTSPITSLTIVCSTVYLGAGKKSKKKQKTNKHQSSVPLAFVRGIHRLPVNSPHKWPVTRKMFPFDDVIMIYAVHKKWCVTYLIKETHGLGALFGYIFIIFSLWFIHPNSSGLLHRFFSRC